VNKYTEFEKNFLSLAGKRVISVHYQSVDYELARMKPFLPDFHSIDISVIFQTGQTEFLEFYWDNTFFSYGMGVRILNEMPIPQELWAIREVSNNPEWRPLIGREINNISLIWQKITGHRVLRLFGLQITLPIGTTTKYPQTVALSLGQTPLAITVGEPASTPGEFHGFTDHLLVFFDLAKAKKIGFMDSI
jgi:hypothetical protein